MAAIEIDNLLDILQQKENDITVNDDTKEIIKILSAIKISKQQILRSYALLSELPNPSLINKGNVYYVEAENGLYVSTGSVWVRIQNTNLSSFSITTCQASSNGNLTYDNTTGEFAFTPADLNGLICLQNLNVCTNVASGSGALAYDDTTGEFNFTPADLSSYAVTGDLNDFICLPDLNVCTNSASGNGCLTYNNTTGEFNFTPADLSSVDVTSAICDFICLTDLSVCTNAASGNGCLSYNDTTGEFNFTPADLSSVDVTSAICDFICLTDLTMISGAPSGNGSLTYDNTTGEFIFNPADLSNKLELLDLSVCTNSANGVGNLSYNNHTGEFAFTPPDLSSYAVTGALNNFICLTDLNVCTNTASGSGALTYDDTTGEFAFTPADLSSYAVTGDLSNFICLTDLNVCTNSASGSGALAYNNTTGEFAFTPVDIDSCFTNGSICNLYMTGTLCGPSTFTIDPAAHGDNTGTVVIAGNLQVDGTTTTVNSCTLEVADKNIVLSCGANNKAASDGAGITADLGSDGTATILYDATDDDWNFNKKVSVTGDIEATGSIIANGTTLGLGDNQKIYTATGAITAGDVVGLNADSTVSKYILTANPLTHILNNPDPYDSTYGDRFGFSVAISESYAIVGAYLDSNGQPGINASGTAYIYDNSTGALLYTLNDPNAYSTANTDQFGYSVAISESFAIVGAYAEDEPNPGGGTYYSSGKAYIYDLSTLTPGIITSATFVLDNPNAYDTPEVDEFGRSVAISESYAIVGAYNEDDAGGSTSGKAYIYDLSTLTPGTITSATFVLDNPNAYSTSQYDYFGYSVAISESYAIVGAYYEDEPNPGYTDYYSSGKAYIYDLSTLTPGTITSATFVLDNPNAYSTPASDFFGSAVAISESYAIVGAHNEDEDGASTSGKAYIYDLSTLTPGTITSATFVLDNPNAYDTPVGDTFGYAVAISESYAIVSALDEDDAGGSTSGKAYIFSTSTGALLETLDNPNAYGTSDQDAFGQAVAISESYAIVGAYYEDDDANITYNSSGKAYIYTNEVVRNWIGIAAEDIADTATGKIDLHGAINRNQTGLTKNVNYYVDANGLLSTQASDHGFIGRAISTTDIQIFGKATSEFSKAIDVDFTTNTPTTTSGLVLTSDGDSSYSFQAPVVTTQIAQLTDVDFITNTPSTTSGLVLTSDGDSSYSFQAPVTQLGDNQKEFIATGAISAGEVVSLRNDGTVEVTQISTVASVENSYTSSLTTPYDTPRAFESAYDSVNNRLFVATIDGASQEILIKIGSISNSVITFDSTITTGISADYPSSTPRYKIAYDETTDQLVLVVNFKEPTVYKLNCYVGTVSGNSISWSTPPTFQSTYPFHITDLLVLPGKSQAVINWIEWNSGNHKIQTVVANLGNNAVTLGTTTTINTWQNYDINYCKSVYIPTVTWSTWGTDASVAIFSSNANSSSSAMQHIAYALYSINANGDISYRVSGGVDSYGGIPGENKLAVHYDSLSQRLVAVLANYTDGSSPDTRIFTSELPTIQTATGFTTGVTLTNIADRSDPVLFTDTTDNLLKFAYSDSATGIQYFSTLTIGSSGPSGTPVTVSDETALTQTSTSLGLDVNIINNDYVFTHDGLGTGSNEVGSTVYEKSYSIFNGDSWVGIAAEDIADGATGKIDLPGAINRSQTGLTPNSIYYVASDGSLTTTATQYGKIGRAYSATELQIFESYKQLNFASQLIFGN